MHCGITASLYPRPIKQKERKIITERVFVLALNIKRVLHASLRVIMLPTLRGVGYFFKIKTDLHASVRVIMLSTLRGIGYFLKIKTESYTQVCALLKNLK